MDFLAAMHHFLYLHPVKQETDAQVAKLVDAPSSGGGAARCAGSNPVLGTEKDPLTKVRGFLVFAGALCNNIREIQDQQYKDLIAAF